MPLSKGKMKERKRQDRLVKPSDLSEIKQGLKEISEGKVIPLSQLEKPYVRFENKDVKPKCSLPNCIICHPEI